MSTYIAGDIGGTNTRLRLFSVDAASADREPTIHYEREYSSPAYSDLAPIVREFLTGASAGLAPQVACFAVAGPVHEGRSHLTNVDWQLDRDRLQQELALERVELINDFAAMSYGVVLPSIVLHDLQGCPAQADAPIAVIGAGTGLGEAFLVPMGGDYGVFPTEGGHTNFAPRNALEDELLQYLRARQASGHVSAENVISGQGILAIYQFLRDRGGEPEAPEVAEQVRAWEQGKPEVIDPRPAISQAAEAQSNALCERTLEMFVGAYAAEVGNFALKLLPYGGLYIAGGIAAKILPLLDRYCFLEIFKQKGPMSAVLERVPVKVALTPDTGLQGAMAWALKLKAGLK